MKRSNRLLILVGVFLAVGSMVLVIALAGGSGPGGQAKGTPSPTPVPPVPVVVAKVDIALGDKITADMVETTNMSVTDRDKLGGETFSTTTQVIGKIAGGTITKGSVLYADQSFLQPGTFIAGQDLASAVAPGKLAVSMEVDQVNGVGALLVPGDHVDIVLSTWVDQLNIATTDVPGAKWKVTLTGGQAVTTKIVIQNRKILATLLPAPEVVPPAANTGGTPTPEPKSSAQTVTNSGVHMIVVVEVQPDEAEIIRWAQRAEKLDPQNYITLGLALRSDKDNDAPAVTTPGITYKQLVTIYGVLPPDPRAVIPADLAKAISW
ncbi:MAG: Flp pilus assembly protein CpaB [Candidatus Limnocylindrales bacterium]